MKFFELKRHHGVCKKNGRWGKVNNQLGLSIVFNSDVETENLCNLLAERKIEFSHAYKYDLSKQELIFKIESQITKEKLNEIGLLIIHDLNEISTTKINWEDGYKGIEQLFILILINHSLKYD